MRNIYTSDPIDVAFKVLGATRQPEAPTGTLRVWAAQGATTVAATSITTVDNVVTARFNGTLTAPGLWSVFLEETVADTAANIIGSTRVSPTAAVRP